MKKKVFIASLICSLLIPTTNLAIAQDASNFVFFHLGEKKDGSLDLNPNKRSFSIKKEESYCWMTTIPAEKLTQKTIQLTEKITTPKAGSFSVSNGQTVKHNKDKTQWTITHNIPTIDLKEQNGLYMGCWIPSNSDPVGEFSLEISTGNTTFPAVKFALTE